MINSYVINTTSNIFTTTDYNHHHETEDPDRLPDGKQPSDAQEDPTRIPGLTVDALQVG